MLTRGREGRAIEGERIYLVEDNGDLRAMPEKLYDTEAILQGLLEEYPDLLAGDQMNRNAPRRCVLVMREAPIPDSDESGGRWSLDHLFLDQDAIPTLVEHLSDHFAPNP